MWASLKMGIDEARTASVSASEGEQGVPSGGVGLVCGAKWPITSREAEVKPCSRSARRGIKHQPRDLDACIKSVSINIKS
jgi:hypothetical protein